MTLQLLILNFLTYVENLIFLSVQGADPPTHSWRRKGGR